MTREWWLGGRCLRPNTRRATSRAGPAAERRGYRAGCTRTVAGSSTPTDGGIRPAPELRPGPTTETWGDGHPLNGTQGPGDGRTYGAPETYGVLAPDWPRYGNETVLAALRRLQRG